uniref:Uncharacterized protein n=1 Tax=viral metagenome TaxID=1070528 RepID=A0A6C0BLA2_9ZZZZ
MTFSLILDSVSIHPITPLMISNPQRDSNMIDHHPRIITSAPRYVHDIAQYISSIHQYCIIPQGYCHTILM